MEPKMPITVGQDTAKTRKTITINGKSLAYYSIPAAQAAGLGDFSKIPAALKVVLENMLRFEDGKTVSVEDISLWCLGRAGRAKSARDCLSPRPRVDAGLYRRSRCC